jgi:hypothetical protein
VFELGGVHSGEIGSRIEARNDIHAFDE